MPDKPPVTFFHPARAWWVQVGVVFFIAVFLGAIALLLWSDIAVWERALMTGALLLLVISMVDKVYFTIYELGPEGLTIHTQLRRAYVPYREMREIIPTGWRALFSTKRRKRFALSSRNITIKVRDALWDEISLSPASDLFLDQLLDKIDTERSRRATVRPNK